MMLEIIGITGRKGSGKSQAARRLTYRHEFTLVKFADPLKEMLRVLGLSSEQLEDPTLKEKPIHTLFGLTPRKMMQTLGTEWGRNLMHPDFWVRVWENRVEKLRAMHRINRVVVDDVRFPNEVQAVKHLGGLMIRVERPPFPQPPPDPAWYNRNLNPSIPWRRKAEHPSEAFIDELSVDITLKNDGCLTDLDKTVDGILCSELFKNPRP